MRQLNRDHYAEVTSPCGWVVDATKRAYFTAVYSPLKQILCWVATVIIVAVLQKAILLLCTGKNQYKP